MWWTPTAAPSCRRCLWPKAWASRPRARATPFTAARWTWTSRNWRARAGVTATVVVHALNVEDSNEYKSGGLIEVGPSNAFWPNANLLIMGHEYTHGVIEFTTRWFNKNEMGGLNEGTCDFFGQMVDTWKTHGGGNPKSGLAPDRIGDKGTTWEISYRLKDGSTRVERSMIRPSTRGGLDAYDSDRMWKGNPYVNAGPLCRALYFLSQGASPKAGDDRHSDLLPHGMAGIGNDATARIWYAAMLDLVDSPSYLQARDAAVRAAERLYPKDPHVDLAVRQAFGAVAVGDPGDTSDPFRSGLGLSGVKVTPGPELVLALNVRENKEAPVADFQVDGISQGRVGSAPYTLKLPAASLFANGRHVCKVYLASAAGRVIESEDIPFDLDNKTQQLLGDPGLEARNVLAARWTTTPDGLIRRRAAAPLPHGGDQCALFSQAGGTDQVMQQRVAIPSTMDRNQLQCWFWVGGEARGESKGETKGPSAGSLALQVVSAATPDAPPTVLETLTQDSRSEGWFQRSYDLSAFAGRTVLIRFAARLEAGSPVWFAVDDVTLQASAAPPEGLVFEDFLTADPWQPSLGRDEIASLLKARRYQAGGKTYELVPGRLGDATATGQVFDGMGPFGRIKGQRQGAQGQGPSWTFFLDGAPRMGPDGMPDMSTSMPGLVDFTVRERGGAAGGPEVKGSVR